jgi:hypothetical protein
MSQNVLPSPARWRWSSLVAGLAALALGCEERKARSEAGAAASRGAERKETPAVVPALVLERPAEPEPDPAPPAGDLASEIEAFSDLKGCAQRHRLADPTVADAVEALGYDRLATDACRAIEALKTKDARPCGEMLSSALRRHCEAQVAMYAGRPELCPLTGRVAGVAEREPLCLAAARRDVRPCAALVGMDRATCEGLVARDEARCGVEGRCLRLVRRWRAALPTVQGRAAHAGRVEVEATRGTSSEALELAREAAQGAVVAVEKGKARLLIGDPRTFFVTDEQQGGGLVLELPAWPPPEARATLGDREAQVTLRWRKVGALTLLRGSKVKVTFEQAPAEPGGALVLAMEASVEGLPPSWRTRWRIDTWLRDVVQVSGP